ncbi:putative zinc ribbon protein [Serratia sp. T13T92]|uniref:putative zinc ribbon protein n=1 Tax=Serratia sp. T13T92 TaxID=3397496 RepID=UPI0039DFA7F1
MKCANLDPQVKADARHSQLRRTVGGLAAPVAVRSWYCVRCQSHYQGEKHCITCNTGIYSIKETRWQENYT